MGTGLRGRRRSPVRWGLLGLLVLVACGVYAWLRLGGPSAGPALVLGELPGRAWILAFTGLEGEGPWRLKVDDGLGPAWEVPAETHAPAVAGTARFLLPARLAGRTVGLTLADPAGGATPLRLTLPPSAQQGVQTLYLGSCLRRPARFGREAILDAIAEDARGHPDPAMLWLGDNLYLQRGDWSSEQDMVAAYRDERRSLSLQALLRAMPQYAVWDDHDYGPNDADRTFPQCAAAQRVFRAHWANPPGPPAQGATYTSVRRAHVELFLLDDRSFRDPLGPGHRAASMLGRHQLDWLRASLLASTAPVKLVVGGSQWLADPPRDEGWQHYPEERWAFLDWLAASGVQGVLFVSGDRHHSALIERMHRGRPFTELTCSSLTSEIDPVDREGYARVRLIAQADVNNYCRIQAWADGSVEVAAFDAQHNRLFQERLPPAR